MSAQPYPQQPSHPYQAPPSPVVARNGFGITALVLAIIGCVFGLIPFTGFIALILGLLAVLFGLLGLGRVRRRAATNKGMAIVGTALGVVSTALGVWGIVIVFSAFDQLGRDLDSLSSAPIAAEQVQAGDPAVAEGDLGLSTAEDFTATPGPLVAAFGDTVTFSSGVTVTIAAPVDYQPTQYAAMDPAAERAMRFSITVVNGSAEPIPYMSGPLVTHAGNAVTGVFDSGNGLADMPMTSLLPGDSTTFDAVFGVGADIADVQVEWHDGFFGNPAIYTGSF